MSNSGFHQLEEQFVRDFSPQDFAESAMVHELTVLTWKKLRLERFEHAALVRTHSAPLRLHELAGEGIRDIALHDLRPSEITIVSVAEVAHYPSALQSIAALSVDKLSAEVRDAIPRDHPALYRMMGELAREIWEFDEQDIPMKELATLIVEEGGEPDMPYLDYALDDLKGRAEQGLAARKRSLQIETAIANIKECRLLDFMKNTLVARASEDLGRAFVRALTELRRHQQWRRQLDAIDVTPEPPPAAKPEPALFGTD